MSQHGGRRPGAGRKPGAPNAQTSQRRELVEAAIAKGQSPIEMMLSIMRDETQTVELRLGAAKAAAPYVHPKLATIEYSVVDPVLQDAESMRKELHERFDGIRRRMALDGWKLTKFGPNGEIVEQAQYD